MPPKGARRKGRGADKGGRKAPAKGVVLCGVITPGPQYQLKTLVGYKNHCISKFRNPAYTFGGRRPLFQPAEGPGPKYLYAERRAEGFTFGLAVKDREIPGPGPKYKSPDVPCGPIYSLKWRTKPRQTGLTPGPYYIKSVIDAPAFTMGLHIKEKPTITPGPYSYKIEPSGPMYTIVRRYPTKFISHSPGPIYAIKPPKPTPAYSFGVKHSECAPPYITECDDRC